MRIIENQTFDAERALYGGIDLRLKNVAFDGPSDGESALKESSRIEAEHCYCNLRYPFWHVKGLKIADSEMTENCRAAIWYSSAIEIANTRMNGIKALRECTDVKIIGSRINSPEFGWSVTNIEMRNTEAAGEYFMLRSRNLDFTNVNFKGKYSFQYVENAVFDNCDFDTKDAFWHGKNILIKNSVVKGEYLAWYSDGLTFENCTIIGTQPLCYCRNLKLINCKMIDTDLCFEKSDVTADITTHIISVKNPYSGRITAKSIGEIIRDDARSTAEIICPIPEAEAESA